IAHQSQSFGRVVGGRASFFDDDGVPITGDSLMVGTRIETGEESLQVALVGRLLASFEPGTMARWHTGSPTLVEIGLLEGTIAVRYDRRPEDPILQIRTPSAVVRVVGTVFTVAVDETGQTTVAVLRGKVEVLDPHDGHHLAEVEAGFRFEVSDSTYRDVG
ncbi:MAG: FecR domain-containing protein, partial [Myxococcales bacterium]|nr:FecR domain-containing protein [Myxococcales bacterium]